MSMFMRKLCARWWLMRSLGLAITVAVLNFTTPAHAQIPLVMQIEEDWELILDAPSTVNTAPQLESVTSPFGHVDSIFARTTWNYREFPDFLAGGMQLQAWNSGTFLAKTNFGTNDLSTVSETVTWTQELKTDGSILTLRIKDGQSTTWGSFGGSSLTLQGIANLSDLSRYSTQVSVDNSGITFGANRVNLFRIKEVRFYDGGGIPISTDSTPKIVFQPE